MIIINVGNFGNRTQIAKTCVRHAIHYTTNILLYRENFKYIFLQLLSNIACIYALYALPCWIGIYIMWINTIVVRQSWMIHFLASVSCSTCSSPTQGPSKSTTLSSRWQVGGHDSEPRSLHFKARNVYLLQTSFRNKNVNSWNIWVH